MPLPTKRKKEKRSEFVSRCVSRESKISDKPTEQIVAMCNAQFERSKGEEILKELQDGERLSLLGRGSEIPEGQLED